MEQSIRPPTSPAIDCGYIRTAHQRVEEMCATRPHPLEPPTASELDEALGERIEKCELLKTNWRNRVYRVALASGRTVIAKQIMVRTNATLQYQYDELEALSWLRIPGWQYLGPALFARPRGFSNFSDTALSMTMQRGKLKLARRKISLARDLSLGNARTNLTTMALLEIEKRWLFRQLARELP